MLDRIGVHRTHLGPNSCSNPPAPPKPGVGQSGSVPGRDLPFDPGFFGQGDPVAAVGDEMLFLVVGHIEIEVLTPPGALRHNLAARAMAAGKAQRVYSFHRTGFVAKLIASATIA